MITTCLLNSALDRLFFHAILEHGYGADGVLVARHRDRLLEYVHRVSAAIDKHAKTMALLASLHIRVFQNSQ